MNAPVRLCCLQRHFGPVCPDGLVMCALCFDRVLQDDLAVEDGATMDVCRSCHTIERGTS